jgi:hypothetical protein
MFLLKLAVCRSTHNLWKNGSLFLWKEVKFSIKESKPGIATWLRSINSLYNKRPSFREPPRRRHELLYTIAKNIPRWK